MIQNLIIGSIFLAALAYLGRLTYQAFQASHSCAAGCGKCGAVDFDKIEKQVTARMSQKAKA